MHPEIASDQHLPASLRGTAAALLDTLVPPGEDGRRPGAGSLDFGRHLAGAPEAVRLTLLGLLQRLHQDHPGFAQAAEADRVAAVRELQAREPPAFQLLLSRVYIAYYESDAVLEALGLEARPPFPKGHDLAPGDMSLLDPVRRRDPFYRPV